MIRQLTLIFLAFMSALLGLYAFLWLNNNVVCGLLGFVVLMSLVLSFAEGNNNDSNS